jgi:hypothetical protein
MLSIDETITKRTHYFKFMTQHMLPNFLACKRQTIEHLLNLFVVTFEQLTGKRFKEDLLNFERIFHL